MITLEEWLYEEDQRLTKGIESWNEFQENRKNKAESENKNEEKTKM